MKPKFWLLTCFTVLASLFAFAGDAPPGTGEESTKKADIVGGVYHSETKKPLNSVTVTVYSNSSRKEKVIYTDLNGNYSFEDLKAGTYKFVFEKDGYKKVTKEKVVVRQDEAVQLNIEMAEHSSFDFMPGPFHFSEFD